MMDIGSYTVLVCNVALPKPCLWIMSCRATRKVSSSSSEEFDLCDSPLRLTGVLECDVAPVTRVLPSARIFGLRLF